MVCCPQGRLWAPRLVYFPALVQAWGHRWQPLMLVGLAVVVVAAAALLVWSCPPLALPVPGVSAAAVVAHYLQPPLWRALAPVLAWAVGPVAVPVPPGLGLVLAQAP